jgi:hypothetical protein
VHTHQAFKVQDRCSATKANNQIKSSLRLLRDRKKEAPFRALRLPDSINWLKPELLKGKTLEELSFEPSLPAVSQPLPA